MTMPLNPFAGAMAASSQVTQRQTADKAAQMRRFQLQDRHTGATEDSVELSVESADELAAIHDESHGNPDKKQKKKQHEEEPDEQSDNEDSHIDLTA